MTNKPSAKTFREPVLRVMGTLTNLDVDATVHRNDVVEAVLVDTGLTVDSHGKDTVGRSNVEVWIGQAFNKILCKRESLGHLPKRNYWSLTPEGVAAAAILIGQAVPTPAPTPEPAVEPEAPTVEPEPESTPVSIASAGGGGIAWTAFGPQVNTYNADPYIRGLAIEQTACFGEFSENSKICETCPLSGACKASVLSRVSDIATRLAKRDADAASASLMPTHPAPIAGLPDDDEEDVEDIVGLIEGDEDDTPPTSIKEGDDLGNGFRAMAVPSDVLCRHCQANMPMGMLAAWKRGDGMYHLACKP